MITLDEVRREVYKEYEIFGKFPKAIHVSSSEWSQLVDEIYGTMIYTHGKPPMDIVEIKGKLGHVGSLFGIPLYVDADDAETKGEKS